MIFKYDDVSGITTDIENSPRWTPIQRIHVLYNCILGMYKQMPLVRRPTAAPDNSSHSTLNPAIHFVHYGMSASLPHSTLNTQHSTLRPKGANTPSTQSPPPHYPQEIYKPYFGKHKSTYHLAICFPAI